jgi:hypothetical protein
MKKNAVSIPDIFVQKISERSDILISTDAIRDLWLRSGGSKSRSAYGMSILLGRGILERVASGLYMKQEDIQTSRLPRSSQ